MSDIFISYSSKDREQAEQLTGLLASAGLSVWIDQSGIDVATSWSGEIVDAIEGCKAFLVLLSPNSIASVNVVKEVALAAEHKKKILPLDLEFVELPRDLKYHLAGIQRAPMSNIDANTLSRPFSSTSSQYGLSAPPTAMWLGTISSNIPMPLARSESASVRNAGSPPSSGLIRA